MMADPAMKQPLLTMLKDPRLKPIAQEAAKKYRKNNEPSLAGKARFIISTVCE